LKVFTEIPVPYELRKLIKEKKGSRSYESYLKELIEYKERSN